MVEPGREVEGLRKVDRGSYGDGGCMGIDEKWSERGRVSRES